MTRFDDANPNRRQALASIGTAAIASIAGCSGVLGGGSGGDDAPDFEVDREAPARLRLLAADVPDDVTFGDSFDAEISFGNAGGEPIETAASVSVVRLTADDTSPATFEVNSDGLASGESRSHSVGPIPADAAGDLRLEPGPEFNSVAEEVEQVFSVAPMDGRMGERVSTPDDLRFTVTGVEYTPALLSKSGDAFELRDTLDDRIIALPQVTVENAGSEGRTIDQGAFSVEAGSRVADVDPVGYDAPDLRGTHVNPGESVDGWIAVTIDRADAGAFDLGINVASAEPPSDVRIPVDGDGSLPEFELVDSQVPSQFQPGDQEFSFTVENTGDATGTFQGYVEYLLTEDPGLFSFQDADTWYSDFGDGMTASIPPGETRTVSEVTSYEGDVDVRYRVNPFDLEFTVAV